MIIKKGEFLIFFDKVYLKVGGWFDVRVYKMLKVVFVLIGDEFVDRIEKVGQFVEFNLVIFSEFFFQYGFEIIIFRLVVNNLNVFKEILKKFLDEFDIVFVNVGLFKGDKDLIYEVI